MFIESAINYADVLDIVQAIQIPTFSNRCDIESLNAS